jgi:hypothetical protein
MQVPVMGKGKQNRTKKNRPDHLKARKVGNVDRKAGVKAERAKQTSEIRDSILSRVLDKPTPAEAAEVEMSTGDSASASKKSAKKAKAKKAKYLLKALHKAGRKHA